MDSSLKMNLFKKVRYIFFVLFVSIGTGKAQINRFNPLKNVTRMLTLEELAQYINNVDGRPFNITAVHSPDGSPDKMSVNGGDPSDFATIDYCAPRMTSIPLPPDPDQTVMLYPECTRVLRCSGCCSSQFKSCQPVYREQRAVSVLRLRLNHPNAMKFDYEDSPQVIIEDEVQCIEQCIVQSDDCTSHQVYDPYDCKCFCSVEQECDASQNKRWNPRLCRCECIEETVCDGFSLFNRETCACEMREVVGGVSEEELEEYNRINSQVVDTEDASTTSTTPTTTTTTPEPTTTQPQAVTPCEQKQCDFGWVGRETSTGVCQCQPPFIDLESFGFNLRRKRAIRRRNRLHRRP